MTSIVLYQQYPLLKYFIRNPSTTFTPCLALCHAPQTRIPIAWYIASFQCPPTRPLPSRPLPGGECLVRLLLADLHTNACRVTFVQSSGRVVLPPH